MKNLNPCITLLSMLLLSSCISVVVTSPQPEGIPPLKEFPARYIGTYIVDKQDTIRIEARQVWMSSEDKMTVNGLDENDIILKPYKKDLILNIRDSTYYALAILRPKGRKNIVLMLADLENKKKLDLVEEWANPSKTVKKGSKEKKYVLESNSELLDELYKHKLFVKTSVLKRIR